MKKKIIIVSHNLRLGGVERSLVGLLNAIDYNSFEVDLFLFLHDGVLMKFIPQEVNLLPENKKYAGLISSVKTNLKDFNFDILLGKRKAKRKAIAFIRENNIQAANLVYDNYLQKFNLKYLPQISDKTYDLTISFLTPHYIAAQKLTAYKKIAWIHTDYSFFDFDKQAEFQMWSAYDHVVSISEDCTRGFVDQFPELESKIVLIENILDPVFIKEQTKAFLPNKEMPTVRGEVKLLSVGRFTHAKNFDNIPEISRHLRETGLKFKWYLIGFGGEEGLIRQKIKEFGVNDCVIVLGKKDNPYPYIKACDFYIQPSRFEGKAVTVREAQILGKPVVITDYTTSQSQLKSGFDGIVVPLDNRTCAVGISSLIRDDKRAQELSKNCKNSDYGNLDEVQKVYKLM